MNCEAENLRPQRDRCACGHRGRPARHDRVGMEQRHRQVARVGGAESEPLREHAPGKRDLLVGTPHSFGIPARARREDQHEQVVGCGGAEFGRSAAVGGEFVCEIRGFDVELRDALLHGIVRRGPVSQHELAVGVGDVAFQGRTATGRVEPHRHDARQRGGDQHGAEERRVTQQHTHVRGPIRVEPGSQRRGQRRTLANVVAPTHERHRICFGIHPSHTAVVDLGQLGQQASHRRAVSA